MPEINPAIIDSWEMSPGKGLEYICMITADKKLEVSSLSKWAYSQKSEQFIEKQKEDGYPKEVFGSAADYPCLLRSIDTVGEVELSSSSKFSILNPEPDCKRMHKWFKRLGMSSYLEQIDGFTLPYESILNSMKVYDTIQNQLMQP